MPAASAGPPKPTAGRRPHRRRGIQADLDRPRSTILLAERGDQLVACAHVADVDGRAISACSRSTRPSRVAALAQLMDAAEAHAAREWNVPVMQMTVIDARRTDRLLRASRLQPHRHPFPYDAFRHPKRDDLRFEILEKPLTGQSRERGLDLCLCRRRAVAGRNEGVFDEVTGTPIVVFNLDGELYALEDQCTHEEFELSSGEFNTTEAVWSACCMGRASTCVTGALCAPANLCPSFR